MINEKSIRTGQVNRQIDVDEFTYLQREFSTNLTKALEFRASSQGSRYVDAYGNAKAIYLRLNKGLSEGTLPPSFRHHIEKMRLHLELAYSKMQGIAQTPTTLLERLAE